MVVTTGKRCSFFIHPACRSFINNLFYSVIHPFTRGYQYIMAYPSSSAKFYEGNLCRLAFNEAFNRHMNFVVKASPSSYCISEFIAQRSKLSWKLFVDAKFRCYCKRKDPNFCFIRSVMGCTKEYKTAIVERYCVPAGLIQVN